MPLGGCVPGGRATFTGHPFTLLPFGFQACRWPSHPAWTISSCLSPSRFASTGGAVAPMMAGRVNGSAGHGMGGLCTPVSIFFGHPFIRRPRELHTYVRPVLVEATIH